MKIRNTIKLLLFIGMVSFQMTGQEYKVKVGLDIIESPTVVFSDNFWYGIRGLTFEPLSRNVTTNSDCNDKIGYTISTETARSPFNSTDFNCDLDWSGALPSVINTYFEGSGITVTRNAGVYSTWSYTHSTNYGQPISPCQSYTSYDSNTNTGTFRSSATGMTVTFIPKNERIVNTIGAEMAMDTPFELVFRSGNNPSGWRYSLDNGSTWVRFGGRTQTLNDLGVKFEDLPTNKIIRFQGIACGDLGVYSDIINVTVLNTSPEQVGAVQPIMPSCNNSINTVQNNNGSFRITFNRELNVNEKMNISVIQDINGIIDYLEAKVLQQSNFNGQTYTWTPQNLPTGSYKVLWQTKSGANPIFEDAETFPDFYDESEWFTIDPPIALSITPIPTDVKCFGGNDGSIRITATGGQTPYQYAINGGAFQPSNVFNELVKGEYTISLRDNLGCEIISNPVEIDEQFPVKPNVIGLPGLIKNPTIIDGNNGRIVIQVSGGSGSYTNYSWMKDGIDFTPSTSSTDASLNDLYAGVYTITVTDSNGCTSDPEEFILTDPDPLVISITMNPSELSCPDEFASLTASAEGGFLDGGDYRYEWNDGTRGTTLFNASIGMTYEVTVSDEGGNSDTASFTVEGPDPFEVIVTKNEVGCKNGVDGSITLQITGGTPFETTINPQLYEVDMGQKLENRILIKLVSPLQDSVRVFINMKLPIKMIVLKIIIQVL